MRRRRVFGILLLFLLALVPGAALPANAQTLTFSDGSSTKTQASGQDFATNVVGDPWDFSDQGDYVWMFSDGWAGRPSVANGKLTGTVSASTSDAAPSLQIQFEGITGAINVIGRNGVAFPIDPNVFNRLSFRMRRSTTPNVFDMFQAFWYQDVNRGGQGFRISLSNGYDDAINRYANQSPIGNQTDPTYHIYKLDLDTPVPSSRTAGNAWNAGVVRGFKIALGEVILAPGSLANATIDVDWVRLTRRGTAVSNLSWSGFPGAVTLTATNGSNTIQIFPDNGTNATTFAPAATFAWDYGFLPSGAWTITAASGGTTRTITLNVSPAPVFNITEPDQSGGTDFATTVIGDPWDMANAQDVTRHGSLGDVTGPTFGATGLTATTTGVDSRVLLLDDLNKPAGSVPSIDASIYRHLTFTIEYDRKELQLPAALTPEFGGLARVFWRPAGKASTAMTTSQDFFVLDGNATTYAMDLATFTKFGGALCVDCTLEDPATPGAASDLWTGSIGLFRIDPYESTANRMFRLANVRLAADDAPTGGIFTIRWNATDATFASASLTSDDSPAVADGTVTLSYDTDTNPASGLVQIAANVAASAGQFAWNTAGLAAGRYYVYATFTDPAGNTISRYSTGPVAVGASAPPPPPPPPPPPSPTQDTDNDGLPDAWEQKFGFNPNSGSGPDGATGDPDGDGVTNLSEFQGGTDPTLPNVWNLSEGATGFFGERLAIANPGVDPATVQVTFLREGGAPPINQTFNIAAQRRITIDVNSIPGLANVAVSVVVRATLGGVVVERTMVWDASANNLYGAHLGKAVQSALTTWYLAEGDANFFDTYILLANAGSAPANVTATYLLTTGSTIVRTYTVGANARLTVFANDVPGLKGQAFSTVVQSSVPITVERAMYFSTGGRFFNGGHEAAGIGAPATNWFVAEGRTGPFFDEYLLLANPQTSQVTATINFLRPGGAPVVQTVTLAPTSRTTIRVDGVPGLSDTDVSAAISATGPIIVERAMYWPDPVSNWYEAHDSAGVTSTGTKWAMAEGEVGGADQWETFILLANPTSNVANVTLTFLRQNGNPVTLTKTLGGNTRVTVSAGEAGLASGERFGVLVDSTNGTPIVVEHAIYFNGAGQFWGAGMNETAVKIR